MSHILMRNRVLFSLLASLFFLTSTSDVQGQKNPSWKADKYYSEYAYTKAIPEYESILSADPTNVEVMRKLAECYRLTNDHAKAATMYGKLSRLPKAKPIEMYYYAQSLMYNGNYELAKDVYTKYSIKAMFDERAKFALQALSKMDQFFADSARARVLKLSINSPESDFSPVITKDGFVFVSNRIGGAKDKKHMWTGKPFLALYATKGKADKLEAPIVFADNIKSKFNDGPASFFNGGSEMYTTRNSKGFNNREDKVVKLNIVRAKLIEGKWQDVEDLAINSEQYNCAHPFATEDGKRLYFASDMPGGYGGMDIYYIEKDKVGAWGDPINLGSNVNTKGNELFPFVAKSNTVYYSSNGHTGLGGLDVYHSKFENEVWTDPKNMGFPINTSKDDFGLVLNEAETDGYIASNRDGGMGDDDIYAVQIFKIIILEGVVTDKETKEPIPNANLAIKDNEGKEISSVITDDKGYYTTELEFNKNFNVEASKPLYSKDAAQVTTINPPSTKITQDFILEKLTFAVEGVVSARETGKPLEGSLVVLSNTDGDEIGTTTVGADGYYYFKLEPQNTYRVKASHEGYFAKSQLVSTRGVEPGIQRVNLVLEKLIINKPIRLDNIYYDVNKWNIRPDAAKELDKLVAIMNDNPKIIIELSAHTDARGSDKYNMTLSDKRAKSAAKYIVQKGGIEKARITGQGYGESLLLNRCRNGVKCSEAEHQENRRTEFKVLKN